MFFPADKAADDIALSPPSITESKNEWSHASTSAARLHGVATHTFRLHLKCYGTRAETRFRLLAKRTSPFQSVGASVQSTTSSLGVRIGGSNDGYTMYRSSVKSTDYPRHSPVSTSLPFPCVTVCHHISIGLQCWIHVSR